MIVATDPGRTVDPFGRTTPDDPGTAPIVCVPTTAITAVVVGLGIDGWVVVVCSGEVRDAHVEVVLGVVEEGPEEGSFDVVSSWAAGGEE